MIVGVSGKKQGGKSFFVDCLKSCFSCSEVVRFSEKLKEIILDCFVPSKWGWTIGDLDLESNKNAVLPCGKTVRYLLQYVGTDQFRSLWEDCWINAYDATISQKDPSSIILTPDVRFPNELRYIQEHGGCVIRLTRAPFSEDDHESEVALDPAMWATVLQWGSTDFDSSISKTQHYPEWTREMLGEISKDLLFSMYLKWKTNQVTFNCVRDNRSCSQADQENWAHSWINLSLQY